MPDGVVEWYDEASGEGRIIRRGHRYTVFDADIDVHGRHPGARVHFDVDRSRGDVAVNATLVPGRGSGRHHRRTGDRSGRRSADQVVGPASASEPPVVGSRLARRPLQLGELWAALAAAGDVEHLVGLYAPHAVVRRAGGTAVGPSAIGRFWNSSELIGRRPGSVSMRDDGKVVVTWSPDDATVLSVSHGEIEDQWVGEIRVVPIDHGPGETPFTVSSSGDVTAQEWNAAVEEVERVLDHTGTRVLAASLRLERSGDPARERGAVASARLDLDGTLVRARADGADMTEAVHRLTTRLRDRLHHLADLRLAARHRGAEHEPGQWRHGDRDTSPTRFVDRPVEERDVVRRKTFAPDESTVEEAIFDLESLDHDFLLFVDLETGEDAVVSRADDAGHHVERASAAPVLELADARAYVEATGRSWLFHRDGPSGRGRVLYRRFDGHYGVITPE